MNRTATVRERKEARVRSPLPYGRGSALGRGSFWGHGLARPAFTLAELMVSVAVLLILMAMVGWIFSTATRSSGIATANNELMGEVRAAEQQLGADLRGMIKDRFIGIWYQLTPDPTDTHNPPERYFRTDRIVFFTSTPYDSIQQLRDPSSAATWGALGLVPPGTGGPNYTPIRGSSARVFLGHSYATDSASLKRNDNPRTWALSRRARVVATDLNETVVKNALIAAATAAKADEFEFELQEPGDWKAAWQLTNPLNQLFGATGDGGWMTESQSARGFQNYVGTFSGVIPVGWMRRPDVDAKAAPPIGAHMLFLPGCAEFKVQRWIERDPRTGTPLGPASSYGMPRWWPEEDIDGDGVPYQPNTGTPADHCDFRDYGNQNIREYFNGPLPTGIVFGTPCYPTGAAAPWYCFGEEDVPKAIKITVRLFDPNKRIADGQVITMTFGL